MLYMCPWIRVFFKKTAQWKSRAKLKVERALRAYMAILPGAEEGVPDEWAWRRGLDGDICRRQK